MKTAFKYSLLNLAILRIDIPFGHCSSHSWALLQLPNPSQSMAVSIALARFVRSGFASGSMQSLVIVLKS
ncbi:MAG: hypothetical protein OCC45_15700 [Desulfotalea sp.]